MTFKDQYNKEMKKQLMEELGIKNPMATPMPVKIVVNVGAGEALVNKNALTNISEQMKTITGQQPIITKARKSISAFKLRKGVPIGVKVTLRGDKMFHFLEKVIKVVMPRIRDFRGINDSNVDTHGNLNLGFTEQTLFPEIEFDKVDKIRGLEVTVVTNAKTKEQGLKLFEKLGVPFKK
jgi:large subunit ribosomal protein L5